MSFYTESRKRVVVQKDELLGNGDKFTFFADHWHEYPDGSLEVISGSEAVASFRPHRWHHVYFEDSVDRIEPKTSRY
jgi:hypothetical protein